MKQVKILRFIFLYSFCLNLSAQTHSNNYHFAPITTEDGLSNNVVYDILQDNEGYMWFATDNGLNRYDGYTITKFFHKAKDSTSIASSVVRSIVEDLDGNIWVGTRNGLNLYNKETESFSQPVRFDSSFITNPGIMKMALGKDGKIWITIENDVGFFDPKTHRFKLVYNLKSTSFVTMTLSNKKVWILNEEGELSYYDINSNKLISVIKDSALMEKVIHFDSNSKQLWLPSEFKPGVDITNYAHFPKLPNNLIPKNLLVVNAHTLWMGTDDGLYEYNSNLKTLNKINLDQSTLVQQIRSIYKDKFGGVWVGTLGGVYHYDSHRKVFRHTDIVTDIDDIVMGLHADKNGIYANALGRGIYHKTHHSENFKKLNLPKTFTSQGLFVWDIETIPQNKFPIWMATNEGLLCLNPITSQFKKIDFPHIDKDENVSFSILNTKGDYVWVSSHKVIHQISKKEGEIRYSFSLIEFIENTAIQKITSLGDYIFIATEGNGLFSFNIKTHKFFRLYLNANKQVLNTPIWDLYASENTLWIGTNQGLYNLNVNDMMIKPVLEDDQVIFSIIQDNDILWMGSDKGIKTFNLSNKKVRYYSTKNGLHNKEFNRKSVTRTRNGHLWFGGVNGITSFDPKTIKKDNPNAPFVYITNLQVITSDSTFNIPNFQKEVVLPWEHNSIEISYVGLNYTNTSQNTYKYKMEGRDPNWVNNNEPNKARYVKLPIGTYVFNVTSSNNDGIWNTKGDRIEITITPPIWRTKSAYAIYVLLILGLISLVRRLKKYRIRIREVEKEKEIIAKKVEEKFIVLNNKTKVYLKDLKYIKAAGNYLEFYTENKTIIDRNKIKLIDELLPPNFIRTHRSYIINKNYIISSNSTSVIIDPNIETPLSRTFKGSLS